MAPSTQFRRGFWLSWGESVPVICAGFAEQIADSFRHHSAVLQDGGHRTIGHRLDLVDGNPCRHRICVPLPGMLELRDTSQTPLHRLVGRHLQSFQAQIDAGDATLPRHVVRSLERFAVCGDAATGFTWLRCDGCGAHRIIAFRCGTRGLCPGCGGRRMASLSHQWIDRVFPEVGVRQWVLSVPWPIRFCLARRHDLCKGLTQVFLKAVFRFYRNRAFVHGAAGGQTGSVTVVQRFGSALNLNIHLHCLVLDGVFVKGHPDDTATFHPLPAPTTEQIEALLVYAVSRMERWLKRQGLEQAQDEISDEDAFAALASASIAGRVALGIRAGKRVRRVRRLGGREVKLPPHCAQVGGFNLHAGVVIGAHNREGLERLCRYVARPPLSSKRMHIQPNGQILIRLKRAWMDGTRHLEFSPIELLEKLAALVPPPRVNQVLYHGILAPRRLKDWSWAQNTLKKLYESNPDWTARPGMDEAKKILPLSALKLWVETAKAVVVSLKNAHAAPESG